MLNFDIVIPHGLLFTYALFTYDDPRLTVLYLFVSCWVHCSADREAIPATVEGCDDKVIYTCKKSTFHFRP